jgi:hypothetical protein
MGYGGGGGGGGSGGGGGGSYGGDGGGGSSSASPPTAGAFRYNTDSSQLEIYDGNQWTGVLATSPEQQTGGTRGVLAGGYTPSAWVNTIDFINISTTGDAADFGDLTEPRGDFSGTISSRTRGCFAGGYFPSPQVRYNVIDYVTIASTGDAIDFGDLPRTANSGTPLSSATRGIYAGGYYPSNNRSNVIDYFTIASTGNAADFGDLKQPTRHAGGSASPTRGIIAGGNMEPGGPSGFYNTIDFVTIATTGNSADFGDLTDARQTCYGASNTIRACFAYGVSPGPTYSNAVDYITIATLGNAEDFGDLATSVNHTSAVTSPTRIVMYGGAAKDEIQYHQIMSTGDFVDFGNLVAARGSLASASNGHGGL